MYGISIRSLSIHPHLKRPKIRQFPIGSEERAEFPVGRLSIHACSYILSTRKSQILISHSSNMKLRSNSYQIPLLFHPHENSHLLIDRHLTPPEILYINSESPPLPTFIILLNNYQHFHLPFSSPTTKIPHLRHLHFPSSLSLTTSSHPLQSIVTFIYIFNFPTPATPTWLRDSLT